MRDEGTKQAAQEYLANKLSEEDERQEAELNNALAVKRSVYAWKDVKDLVLRQCDEWNKITQEQTLSCKETLLGDLRIWCAAQARQMTVHFDSKRLTITVKNAGRAEHEKDVVLQIEGYRTGADRNDRDIRLRRSDQTVNIDSLILGELRVLTGMKRQRDA
jgi:hypothetical protein